MTPAIAIYVRHTPGCKYMGDEYSRRCDCRKHLRWTADGKQHRLKAGTRSWAEAERVKRELEDQLAGRAPAAAETTRHIRQAVETFLADKRVQGVAEATVATYARQLDRLATYCESKGVYTVQSLTREILTGYCATWERTYTSSATRCNARARCRSFLRYCYEAEWIPRIPSLPVIRADGVPTLPLTADEFERLLASVDRAHPDDPRDENRTAQRRRIRQRVRALFLLMRYSGLALRDATSLPRAGLLRDPRGFYRVVTKRQKTGTDVSVAIPKHVGDELLAAPNENPAYFFWTGDSTGDTNTTHWQTRFIAPVFKAAGLYGDGHMVSHRLRDTFAVDLLEKGVPLEEVSKLLGHESIKTTEKHYAKWSKGRQDRLDNLVIGTW